MARAEPAEGRDRRYCGGKKRQGEGNCARPAGWGTPHPGIGRCKLHGGSTRTQTAGAERRQAEDGARQILADLGTAGPVDNPIEALRELAGEVLAFRDALRTMVERLNSPRYSTDAGEHIRGEVVLYERALDRCSRILTDMARLNLDERLVRISEAQAGLVVTAIRNTFAAIDLTPKQQQQANTVVARELRALSRAAT